jgi:hypothetical protein
MLAQQQPMTMAHLDTSFNATDELFFTVSGVVFDASHNGQYHWSRCEWFSDSVLIGQFWTKSFDLDYPAH